MSLRERSVLLPAAALMVAALGCGGSIRTFRTPPETDSSQSLAALQQIASSLPSTDYKLGPGDVVEVKVYGVDGLEATVRIPEAGAFDFPLVGSVQAAGSTALEVEKAIAASLRRKYLNDPHVSVFIKEFKSYRVSVVGSVVRPGTVVLTKGSSTLVDALAEAGGLTDEAGPEVFVTKRDTSGRSHACTVDLHRLLKEGALDENLPLDPGDSIYVAECGYVFVTGYVKQPGAYLLRADMTTLQAISTAGDFLDRASRRVRLIRRISPGTVEIRRVNLSAVVKGKAPDIKLRKSDVLEAEASLWKVPVYGTFDFIKNVLGIGTSIR